MTLHMIELAVNDVAESARWYTQHGLTVELSDRANGFVLLNDGGNGRVALKAGTASQSTVLLHFCVEVLPPGVVKESAEGYRRVIVKDPDGYRVCFFQMLT